MGLVDYYLIVVVMTHLTLRRWVAGNVVLLLLHHASVLHPFFLVCLLATFSYNREDADEARRPCLVFGWTDGGAYACVRNGVSSPSKSQEMRGFPITSLLLYLYYLLR